MSQGNDDTNDMRPEYDIRGGVRGKYLERYRQTIDVRIMFEESAFTWTSTATSAPPVGSIMKPGAYNPAFPSPKIKMGEPAKAA